MTSTATDSATNTGTTPASSTKTTTTDSTKSKSANSNQTLSGQALFYMVLLAIQFGIQPMVTKRYTSQGVCRSTVILTQECTKFVISVVMLYLSTGSGSFTTTLSTFSLSKWVSIALLPAGLYAVQNLAALMAYQNLDPLTYNVLNQTKTLSAALCCYLVMGYRQSSIQILSLLLLLLAALIMEKIIFLDFEQGLPFIAIQTRKATPSSSATTTTWNSRHFTHGVSPILLASFISGLAGALTQRALQKEAFTKANPGGAKSTTNPYLFSMELCGASAFLLALSLLVSSDGKQIFENGFFHNWNYYTYVPIFINSCGGIVVGLVTKYAGSVRKGHALIFGILLSGILQQYLSRNSNQGSEAAATEAVTNEQIIGGVLAALSLYLHSTYPPAAKKKTVTKPVKQD